jgi:hypothetical protein
MTNVEILQKEAVERLEKNELNSYENDFVEKIRNYSKKDLKGLTSNQYWLLRKIAEGK